MTTVLNGSAKSTDCARSQRAATSCNDDAIFVSAGENHDKFLSINNGDSNLVAPFLSNGSTGRFKVTLPLDGRAPSGVTNGELGVHDVSHLNNMTTLKYSTDVSDEIILDADFFGGNVDEKCQIGTDSTKLRPSDLNSETTRNNASRVFHSNSGKIPPRIRSKLRQTLELLGEGSDDNITDDGNLSGVWVNGVCQSNGISVKNGGENGSAEKGGDGRENLPSVNGSASKGLACPNQKLKRDDVGLVHPNEFHPTLRTTPFSQHSSPLQPRLVSPGQIPATPTSNGSPSVGFHTSTPFFTPVAIPFVPASPNSNPSRGNYETPFHTALESQFGTSASATPPMAVSPKMATLSFGTPPTTPLRPPRSYSRLGTAALEPPNPIRRLQAPDAIFPAPIHVVVRPSLTPPPRAFPSPPTEMKGVEEAPMVNERIVLTLRPELKEVNSRGDGPTVGGFVEYKCSSEVVNSLGTTGNSTNGLAQPAEGCEIGAHDVDDLGRGQNGDETLPLQLQQREREQLHMQIQQRLNQERQKLRDEKWCKLIGKLGFDPKAKVRFYLTTPPSTRWLDAASTEKSDDDLAASFAEREADSTNSALIPQKGSLRELTPGGPFSNPVLFSLLRTRPFYLTLMVVGESGLGKSTLVDSLFLTDLYSDDVHRLKGGKQSKTVQIRETKVEIQERGIRLRLRVIDTPGFGDAVNNDRAFKSVAAEIEARFQQYRSEREKSNKRRGWKDEDEDDPRVHCCLYFIRPGCRGLRPLDVQALKALQNRVNLVPIIAKGDTLTKEELDDVKVEIRRNIQKLSLDVFEIPKCEEAEDDDFAQENEDLRRSWPFAVCGANAVFTDKLAGKKIRGRRYPWGIVDIENKEHCDFVRLRSLLVLQMEQLKQKTHRHFYARFEAGGGEDRHNKSKEEGRSNLIRAGSLPEMRFG